MEVDINEIYVSADIMQKIFNISAMSLTNWTREGLPKFKHGRYPLVACAKWVRENKIIGNEDSLVALKKEKLEIENEMKRIKLAIEKKELIPREEVLQAFLDRIHVVKSGLMALPRMLAQTLVGKDERGIMDELKKAMEDFLERFSRKGGILK